MAVVLIPLILCTRTCVIALLLCSTSHLALEVGLPHTLRVSMGVPLFSFFLLGQLHSDKIIFG